jgi:hypothetical protein
MTQRYFEDFAVGQTFGSSRVTGEAHSRYKGHSPPGYGPSAL